MAAHRYWRAVNLEAYDGGALIELSEAGLLVGATRVDAGAALTSSLAPVSGSLASLADGNTGTAVVLARGTVLSWDYGGSPQDVTDIRLGSADDVKRFTIIVKLQFSDDAISWTDYATFSGIAWPGRRVLTASIDPSNLWSRSDHGANATVSADQLTLGTWSTHSGRGLVPKSAGKVQFEITLTSLAPSADFSIGIGTPSANVANYTGAGVGSFGYNRNGNKYLEGVAGAYGATYTTGDVIGVVVDFSTGSLTFYKNGVSQGVASATGLLGLTLLPMAGHSSGGATPSYATLRGKALQFPVAGAAEWAGVAAVARNMVLGRAGRQDGQAIASGGAAAVFAGAVLKERGRARPNFLFDPAARGRIIGTVKTKNTPTNMPLARRVRLYRDVDGMLIAETWSRASDGVYQFDYIEERQSYTAIALDHEHVYRMVGADNLNQENGTLVVIP